MPLPLVRTVAIRKTRSTDQGGNREPCTHGWTLLRAASVEGHGRVKDAGLYHLHALGGPLTTEKPVGQFLLTTGRSHPMQPTCTRPRHINPRCHRSTPWAPLVAGEPIGRPRCACPSLCPLLHIEVHLPSTAGVCPARHGSSATLFPQVPDAIGP